MGWYIELWVSKTYLLCSGVKLLNSKPLDGEYKIFIEVFEDMHLRNFSLLFPLSKGLWKVASVPYFRVVAVFLQLVSSY